MQTAPRHWLTEGIASSSCLHGPSSGVSGRLSEGEARGRIPRHNFSRRRREWGCRAQRRQRDEQYVEFDDDYGFNSSNFSLDFLPATSGRVLRTLQTLTDRFVDVIYDLFPVGTSRSVVETVTKGGALLVTLAFASSILTFLLNAGLVVLAVYVAAKVFRLDIGGFNSDASEDAPRRNSRPSDGPPRRSRNRTRFKTDAGQAVSDLTDVWFEQRPRK